jgi:hypothetical protein
MDERRWTMKGFRQYVTGPQLDGSETITLVPESCLVAACARIGELEARPHGLFSHLRFWKAPTLAGHRSTEG